MLEHLGRQHHLQKPRHKRHRPHRSRRIQRHGTIFNSDLRLPSATCPARGNLAWMRLGCAGFGLDTSRVISRSRFVSVYDHGYRDTTQPRDAAALDSFYQEACGIGRHRQPQRSRAARLPHGMRQACDNKLGARRGFICGIVCHLVKHRSGKRQRRCAQQQENRHVTRIACESVQVNFLTPEHVEAFVHIVVILSSCTLPTAFVRNGYLQTKAQYEQRKRRPTLSTTHGLSIAQRATCMPGSVYTEPCSFKNAATALTSWKASAVALEASVVLTAMAQSTHLTAAPQRMPESLSAPRSWQLEAEHALSEHAPSLLYYYPLCSTDRPITQPTGKPACARHTSCGASHGPIYWVHPS